MGTKEDFKEAEIFIEKIIIHSKKVGFGNYVEKTRFIESGINLANKIIESKNVNNDLLIEIHTLKSKIDFLEKKLNEKDVLIENKFFKTIQNNTEVAE